MGKVSFSGNYKRDAVHLITGRNDACPQGTAAL